MLDRPSFETPLAPARIAAPRPRRLAVALVVLAAAALVALTWFGATSAIVAEQREARARATADVANQALLFEDQLRRELLVLDQTLRILEAEWEANPQNFDLQAWLRRALVLPDISLHIFITDANGIIRASTRPELIGVDVSGRDYFRYEASLERDNGRMFIGPSTRGLVTNRWQINMARRLDNRNGRFVGVIGVSYDTAALTRFYRQADLGDDGMIALVGTDDGKLRALVGPVAVEPGYDVSGSEMYRALRASPNGRWTGPSAVDGVRRVHAFRKVVDRDLAVVVAVDSATAMGASLAFTRGAQAFAGGTTLFILVIAGGVLRDMYRARRREFELDHDRAVLAAANAELQAARRQADRKTAQLEATLAGMSDGVSMLDAELRLVAWNTLFPEFTGVPPALLKVGTPMEDIVRAQARAGEFGPVDVEGEVARRMQLLRSGSSVGVIERPRPGGRMLELRRSPLPGGGFVTLYTDITARKQAEESMRRARELAEATTEAKSRFVATVSHEIRTPLNTLLNSLRLLSETQIPPAEQRLVEMARQAGDGLLGLINDILEMSKMEAGRLTLRPSLFALRPLLAGVIEMFAEQAAARHLRLALELAPGVPDLVHSDSGRIRQILLNLVSNAVKFAAPGTVRLVAALERGGERPMLRLAVRDPGPTLSSAERSRLFQPFARLDRPQDGGGTGLGLAICQGLAGLLEAEIGCDPVPGGGNEFWLALPIEPGSLPPALAEFAAAPGPLPRTRILLVEDVVPNQLVTATMLRREGHHVDVALSGEAALAMLARASYDIVFMDVFMPGMDGLETTRRVRALPPPVGQVPVVALTANASPEDHARAVQAGMNDLVAKPVDPARLLGAIARHVWPARRLRPAAAAAPPPPPEPPTPTLSGARIAELRANLAVATLAGLAEECLAELQRRNEALRTALEAGDAGEIEQQCHAISGVASSYGLAALDRRVLAVRAAARQGDLAAARREGAGLAGELERAGPALRAACAPEIAALP